MSFIMTFFLPGALKEFEVRGSDVSLGLVINNGEGGATRWENRESETSLPPPPPEDRVKPVSCPSF